MTDPFMHSDQGLIGSSTPKESIQKDKATTSSQNSIVSEVEQDPITNKIDHNQTPTMPTEIAASKSSQPPHSYSNNNNYYAV